jgi:hypothetical protein
MAMADFDGHRVRLHLRTHQAGQASYIRPKKCRRKDGSRPLNSSEIQRIQNSKATAVATMIKSCAGRASSANVNKTVASKPRRVAVQ